MIRNAVQHSENGRNSLVVNYKSAALTNWAMPAFPIRKLFSGRWARFRHDPSLATRYMTRRSDSPMGILTQAINVKKGADFTVFFYGVRMF